MTDKKYETTIKACFVGYIVQAVVNNFAPLLFVTFQSEFDIPLSQITALVSINFIIQLLVDLLSAKVIDKIGYRVSMVAAHFFSAAGIIFMTILPGVFKNAFAGLLISVIIYAVGGGVLEVLVSPIVESCPTDNKEKAMSLLHSFYCWGHMLVVILSTLFFSFFGLENWRILAFIWAALPVANAFVFMKVPIASLNPDGEKGLGFKELLSKKMFWILFFMMVCAGASEQAVSQWASLFAEKGLKVTKSVGDLAGPMAFACLMGISRAFYGKMGHKIKLNKFMIISCVLCIFAYLTAGISSNSVLGLIGCALCGLSVGIMWPGSFSKASAAIKNGGTVLFALLALGGDIGCTAGPSFVGIISELADGNLQKGILAGVIFPAALLIFIRFCRKNEKTIHKNQFEQ